MPTDYSSSTRWVAGHPIHTYLAAFPIALFTAAFVTDITYANTAQMMWADFSIWLITGGLIGGGLAAIAGIVDAVIGKPARERGTTWPHTLGSLLVLALSLLNAFVHSRDAWTSVVPTGLVLSGIVVVLVVVTTWLGARIVERPRMGVA